MKKRVALLRGELIFMIIKVWMRKIRSFFRERPEEVGSVGRYDLSLWTSVVEEFMGTIFQSRNIGYRNQHENTTIRLYFVNLSMKALFVVTYKYGSSC